MTTFWEVPLEPPGEKNGDKREKLRKKQTKHVLEVLLRFSVGYILEMDQTEEDLYGRVGNIRGRCTQTEVLYIHTYMPISDSALLRYNYRLFAFT